MKLPAPSRSLRLKLVLASVVVEILMLTVLVVNSLRLMESSLEQQARANLEQIAPLLNASLAAPLMQRDYVTLADILRESIRKDGVTYLVLFDNERRVVAALGWSPNQPLPELDEHAGRSANGVFDTEIPIQLAGQTYGKLRYGTSTEIFTQARSHLLNQSLLIALAAILLSAIFLALIGYWLTRHLKMLTQGAEEVARGDFDISLPVHSDDEIGKLTTAFNIMTANIRADMEALRAGGELQLRYLLDAQQEHARLNSLLSAMNIGILFVSPDSRVVYLNPAFLHVWMIPAKLDDLVGKPLDDAAFVSPSLQNRTEGLAGLLLKGRDEPEGRLEIDTADGRTITQHNYPVRDREDRLVGCLTLYEDVTQERHTARQLVYLAERDSLTGLYNRHRFQEELARMMNDAQHSQTCCALLFFDLDEFKYINDTFGHSAGDTILIRIAGDIGARLGHQDIFSRLGGDEFAILIPNSDEHHAEALAERVVRAIAQLPFSFEGQNLRLTSSLGIAYYPHHAAGAEELIAHADAAMYQAKEAGKNAWRVYREDRDAAHAVIHRLSWNERIVDALENNLLVLHFQGIYRAGDCTLSHLEALVRMHDKENPGKLLMPGSFIPTAEKTGKILDIDRWVIRAVIAQLAAAPQVPSIAVNISGRSFDEPSLPGHIAALLREYGVAPARLLVELTETAAVSDMQDAQRFIDALRATGCQVCLDDFGTGFASFAYLKHIHVDILKIDGIFIRDLTRDYSNQLFVKAIVDVARGMGKTTVAEFVENQEILDMLRGFGVDQVQGYHLDKPRPDHPALGGHPLPPA